ncbi:MAG: ArsA family ATPase, partial [Gemmatimonadota bacterium]|nr:ArsA family ATPase [Gemmatimonadota bacterium]
MLRLLQPLPRWTLVGGKGGVGKTTVAASLAIALADAGERTLVLSADPAHSLGDALGVALGPEPLPVPGVQGLRAMEVSAAGEHARFVERYGSSLLEVIERGSYLERADAERFLELPVPGMDELAALLRLRSLAGADERLRVVVDTAPTGHTLRLLALPRLAGEWLDALDAVEARHRTVVVALSGAPAPDEASRALERLRADLDTLRSRFVDPAHTRFLLVSTSEPVVREETRRLRSALAEQRVSVAGLVLNRAGPG